MFPRYYSVVAVDTAQGNNRFCFELQINHLISPRQSLSPLAPHPLPPPPSRLFVAISESDKGKQGSSNTTEQLLSTACIPTPGDDDYAAEVNTEKFASAALSDPEIAPFLAMRTAVVCRGDPGDLTLREALRQLGRGGSERAEAGGVGGGGRSGVAGEEASTVRWEDVEGLLFDPYDPGEIMANPPLAVSISSPTCAEGAQEEEVRLAPRSEKSLRSAENAAIFSRGAW